MGDKRHACDGTVRVLDMGKPEKAQETGFIGKTIFEIVQEIFNANTDKLEFKE